MDEVELVARATMDIRKRVALALCRVDEGAAAEHYIEATDHHGDCTRESYQCSACLGDYYRELADAAIAAMPVSELQNAIDHLLINIGEEGFIPRTEAIRKYGHLRSAPPKESE